MTRPTRRLGFIVAVFAGWVMLAGCQSAQQQRDNADRVAYDIISQKQEAAIGRSEPFAIETPADTLRRRLLRMQGLPTAGPASLGSDQLEPIDHWPEDDYLASARTADAPVKAWQGDGPVSLSLDEALRVAARNNRDYQTQKELVFQTALALDLERDAFRTSLAGLVASGFTADYAGADTLGVSATPELSAEQRFKDGLTISGRILIDLVQLLNSPGSSAYGLFTDLSATIPLLAGSGEHIVAEPLTQAERDVVYALWSFERFKRTFAVDIASDYLAVLQQEDQVKNARDNYRSLIDSYMRAKRLAEAGRLPELQVDQAEQDMLRARDGWIGARAGLARTVDVFKIALGLPTDATVELQREELTHLADVAREALGRIESEGGSDDEYTIVDRKVVILEPSDRGAGPLELPERRAIELALRRRLDLRTAQQEVEDAKRTVVVTADALRPGLGLTVTGAAGGRRGIGGAGGTDAQLRPEEGTLSVLLDFDAPWDKQPQRNAYRNALISLEQAVRDVQASEDRVKLQIRDALRTLREARESYRIQSQALTLAQRRVDSTNLFLQAGRAEIRDLLEAQEALIDAQNALTAALVDYRIAELELQRDAGVLIVNEKGMWREYRDGNINDADRG